MKKSGLIFAVIIVILLVSGQSCEKKAKGEGVFIGGKNGLVSDFVDDAPSISGNFQNEAFPIEVRLTNKGETDVGKGSAKIYLTGALYSAGADLVTVTKKEGSNDDIIIAIEEEGAGELIEDSTVVSMGDAIY